MHITGSVFSNEMHVIFITFIIFFYREADESLKKLEDKYKNDVKSLQHRINEAEERLKGLSD